jgi:hypothetical protein
MPSHLSPRRSLLSLLGSQIEAVPDAVLSPEARSCLVSYAHHLGALQLDRTGDHMVAGLLLNAPEIAAYIPSGKLGKGSMELTRLEERIERVLTAARRLEKRRMRRGSKGREGWGPRMKPPVRTFNED